MPLIDVHTHLNDQAFADDLDMVLAGTLSAGVERMVVAGFDLPSSRAAVAIAAGCPGVWATVGISPHEAKTWSAGTMHDLARLAESDKVVAIGEIGLDYHYDFSPRDIQHEAFRAQIELAVSLDLPIVVHDREAHADVLDVLKAGKPRLRGGIMHCFSGSLEMALAAWSMGFLISFAGPVTFTNAHRLRDVAAKLPLESLLTETDAPYLTPHPHRGRRNEPAMVKLVAEALAETRGIPLEVLTGAVWLNAERVLGFVHKEVSLDGGPCDASRL